MNNSEVESIACSTTINNMYNVNYYKISTNFIRLVEVNALEKIFKYMIELGGVLLRL
jgi:hypothetical protein